MDLNLIYETSTNSAPAGFRTALTAAANYLDKLITNPITVNIQVGWGDYNGTPLTNQQGSTGGIALATFVPYNQLATALYNNVDSPATFTAFENLPNSAPGSYNIAASNAQRKAWGLMAANGTEIDGYVGFGTAAPYNYSTTGANGTGDSFMGIALHELTHALGRFSGLGYNYLSVLDLYRYSAPGVLQDNQSTPFAPAYFSINGGTTDLAAFDTTSDNSDWAGSVPNDSFDAVETYGLPNLMTTLDISEMNVLGFAIACFAAGTRIRTTRGDVPVEALRAGRDSVITAQGAVAAIRWIGARTVIPARHNRPEAVMPVRVSRGALAPGRPARDLSLSPDHAVFLDGALIPVRCLTNGRSIVPVPVARVRYLHVELANHDVILAEGLPVESYLDTGNRAAFARTGRSRRPNAESSRHIWASRGCAPLVLDGPRLIAARRAVLRRAAALGHRLTDDPGLIVRADATPLRPLVRDRLWQVMLPRGTRQLRLTSRAHVPAQVMPEATDPRRLGIALRRLWIDGREAALDSPALHAGWHRPEPGWRWTTGDAAIAVDGARHLAFTMAITGRYWAGAA